MKVLITGAAGFVGAHTAATFLKQGATVVGLDNLSRRGNVQNLQWLEEKGGDFHFAHGDIRNETDMMRVLARHKDTDVIVHLAGQVAVTTSVTNPRLDFEGNALGTFNMLEATRLNCPDAIFLFSSTNKVYGGMEEIVVVERDGRYVYRDYPEGITEHAPLDFHSPYGCSKGSADQYVRDYARIYGLRSVVFRQSCIYGTRQFGIEDQGWVAWFTIATVLGKPITLFGDGKQIRDLLWVEDLVSLYQRAIEKIDVAKGQAYNAGGGMVNTLSLRELMAMLTEMTGLKVAPAEADWRPGDQRVFVADSSKAKRDLGWEPTVSPRQGVGKLLEWTLESKELLRKVLP